MEHRFRWSNGAPLNDANADLEVNFLEYWERRPNGAEKHFSWVTDLRRWNAMALTRAGRARWRIENETFNTLKNQGYEFEHNFGHGEKHLATVFAALMLLAFAIDQLRKACCPLFRAALARKRRPKYFWEDFRSMFTTYLLPDWDTFYRALAPSATRERHRRPRHPEAAGGCRFPIVLPAARRKPTRRTPRP